MKIIIAIILWFVVAGFSTERRACAQTSLLTLTPLEGGGLSVRGSKFSMSERIFNIGLYAEPGHDDGRGNIYDLAGKYSRLEGWIGRPDQFSSDSPAKWRIKVDGETVLTGEVSQGDKPVHVDININGAKSLKIGLWDNVTFATPFLYKGSVQPVGVVNLIAPADGVRATGNNLNLLWEPVDGATSYGVEIVCTKGGSPHIYALNVTGGDSNTKFDLTNVPNGEYQWSVIAFNGKGVMGKFSKDRTFVVAR